LPSKAYPRGRGPARVGLLTSAGESLRPASVRPLGPHPCATHAIAAAEARVRCGDTHAVCGVGVGRWARCSARQSQAFLGDSRSTSGDDPPPSLSLSLGANLALVRGPHDAACTVSPDSGISCSSSSWIEGYTDVGEPEVTRYPPTATVVRRLLARRLLDRRTPCPRRCHQ